ncbi:IS982 family transposase, partial [Streptomyces sp. NPDC055085]
MKTDLDTLATALYVKVDDALRASPQLAPWRPEVGIAPTLSDAELVTLAVMSALLGYTSERRWLRRANRDFRHLFPYLPQQSGY